MICEKCNLKPAKVHIIKIINGKKTSMNFCELCAKKYENIIIEASKTQNINNMISSLFDTIHGQTASTMKGNVHKCTMCGLTLDGFRKSGRLGCPECYEIFKNNLDGILEKVQGQSIHVGKIPQRTGGELKIKNKILNLKKQLEEKIKTEEFEDAAVIRDEIKELECNTIGGDDNEESRQHVSDQ